MENKKLLVCIAFHYNEDRFQYLNEIIGEFRNNYGNHLYVDIIIDSNKSPYEYNGVDFIIHENLAHPFHITWMHRKHIKENIDKYDYFMYVEDDMLVPWENFKAYIEKFELLYPKYVPSFVRIEEKEGDQYVSDVPEHHSLVKNGIINIEGRMFTALKFPHNYHAFWIIPQKELKESMNDSFCQLTDGREFAASYTAWELGKKALIEIRKEGDKYVPHENNYSYHLPNNYALSEGHPNGKIKPKDLFI